jgi:hypothetical protein
MTHKTVKLLVIILLIIIIFPISNLNFVSAVTAEPAKIKLYLSPIKLPADSEQYECIFVQLLDSSGKPARATKYVHISLSSSKTEIGTVDSSITINPGATFGKGNFYTTSTPGSTTITATATDFTTVQTTITTTIPGTIPTKLVVFCTPQLLPADNQEYKAIFVQLQDGQSRPTENPGEPIYVNMFSSESSIGFIYPLLTIDKGKSLVVGSYEVSNSPGSTTITAQASNFATGQAKLTTYQIDLSAIEIELTSMTEALLNGKKTDLIASVKADGIVLDQANLKFTSDNGGTFTTIRQQADGSYKTTFTAPSLIKTIELTITATASKTGYVSSTATTKITVGPIIQGNKTGLIQFLVIDEDGTALGNTVISTVIQPKGMGTLFNITNSAGYVTFENLVIGTYTFRIIKEGFPETNQTISYKGQPITLTLTLVDEGVDNKTLMIIAAAVISAIATGLAAGLIFVRRKRSIKIRKLQELQKQLENKQGPGDKQEPEVKKVEDYQLEIKEEE